MNSKMWCFDYQLSIEVEIISPSFNDVENWIDRLDNQIYSHFHLQFPEGIITVCGGNSNRVILFFNDQKIDQWGRLLDTIFSLGDGHVDILSGEEHTPELLYETVTKEVAKQTLLYFMENLKFSKDSVWRGNMNKIINQEL